MFDFDVEILVDDELTTVNFYDYIKNKTVLVCPTVNIMDWPTLDYYKYVDSLFDSSRIDEILLINHTDDMFFHMHINSHFPRFTTVSDRHQNYIKELKQDKDIKVPQTDLVKKWIFQHLLKDGKEEGFWQQPLSNQWDYFWQRREKIKSILQAKAHGCDQPRTPASKILQKLYNKQQRDIYDFTCMNWLYLSKEGKVFLKELAPLIYYFDLWHNKELEAKLTAVHQ